MIIRHAPWAYGSGLARRPLRCGAASAQEGEFAAVGDRPHVRAEAAQQTTGQEQSDGPTTEQVLRIERLESQIRQLTGTIEQLQYRNQQLEQQLRGARRWRPGAAARSQPQPAAAARPQPPSAAAAPGRRRCRGRHRRPPTGRRSDVFDPSQQSQCAGRAASARQRAERAAAARSRPSRQSERRGGRRAGAPLDLSTLSGVPGRIRHAAGGRPVAAAAVAQSQRHRRGGAVRVAPPSDSPKDDYDLGYGYVLRKDYALAEDTFQAFLKKYPTDRRAADAQFWLGESLFQRQRYDAAAQLPRQSPPSTAATPRRRTRCCGSASRLRR